MTALASSAPTAETAPLTFTVYGDPIPQGSMKPIRRGGKTVLVSDNPKLDAWRSNVVLRAREAWNAHAGRRGSLYGPVRLELVFAVRQRALAPKGWRTREAWNTPTTQSTGDLDKLTRAVFDAITISRIYVDDSQVVELSASQHYADGPGCPMSLPGVRITISEVQR